MKLPDTPDAFGPPVAHPLVAVAARAAHRAGVPRVLLAGAGSGRHIAPLLTANVAIDAIEPDAARANGLAERFASDDRVRVASASLAGPYPFAERYGAVLSTHALLHGRAASVGGAIAALGALLVPGGAFVATLGSQQDRRFGDGRRLDARTFAPQDGEEVDVPHAFFDEADVRVLFAAFALETLDETDASDAVGRWAHEPHASRGFVHWFAVARRSTI